MRIVVESRGEQEEEKYVYETIAKLPFMSSFRVKHNIKEVNFFRNNRTNYIYISNLNDLDMNIEEQKYVQMEVNSQPGNNFIKLYVPHNVTEDFQNVKLILTNKITNQKHDIKLNFLSEKESEIRFLGISRGNLIDFFTLIFLIATIVILYNYVTSNVKTF
jgi:hypothetical protein